MIAKLTLVFFTISALSAYGLKMQTQTSTEKLRGDNGWTCGVPDATTYGKTVDWYADDSQFVCVKSTFNNALGSGGGKGPDNDFVGYCAFEDADDCVDGKRPSDCAAECASQIISWGPADTDSWTLMYIEQCGDQCTGSNGVNGMCRCCQSNGLSRWWYPTWKDHQAILYHCDYTEPATTPAPAQHAAGDPHLLNIKGERFNVARTGYAPLVHVASDGTDHLEVMALIEGVQKCRKKMFITNVNASGSWLEKHVAVFVGGREADSEAFTLMVDGQKVWSPEKQRSKTENVVFNHESGKFSIQELGRASNAPGIKLKMSHDIQMTIKRPLIRSSSPPHLNFDIEGLRNLPHSFKLGGLLGVDDHSYWTSQSEDCVSFAAVKQEDLAGSIASAH